MSTLSNAWIVKTPGVCGGRPRVKGTRLTVANVLSIASSGSNKSEIFLDYPGLNETKIQAALQYASEELDKDNVA